MVKADIIIKMVNIRPALVTGTTSPSPMVLKVEAIKYSDFNGLKPSIKIYPKNVMKKMAVTAIIGNNSSFNISDLTFVLYLEGCDMVSVLILF